MKEFIDKIKPFAPMLAIVVLMTCVGTTLYAYESPVYAANTFEEVEVPLADTPETVQLEEQESSEEEMESIAPRLEEAILLDTTEKPWKDGVYTGVGEGFAGEIEVEVTVENQRITDIKIIRVDGDDAAFFNRAKGVIDRILARQNTDVDVISGATFSSKGIISAVNNALSVEADEEETVEETVVAEGTYADGIYYGTGVGYGGTIQVSVEVKENKIVDIQILEVEGDGDSYIDRAKGVIEQIISKQSYEVDTISGATYSSRGIISAVKNALTGESSGVQIIYVYPEAELADIADGTFTDGTYYGSGTGFSGDIKVKVVIYAGRITGIEIEDSADESKYMRVASQVIVDMITEQSTNVDTVSGATFSSTGIINAVRDALSQSSGDTGNEDDVEEVVEPVTGKMPYQEGIYYGTAEGYWDDITVGIVIQDQTLKNIIVTASEDDETFLTNAKKVIDLILAEQSTEVDTISGATFSSTGILNAVKKAILEAEKATNAGDGEETTEEDTTTEEDSAEETTEESTTEEETDEEDSTEGGMNDSYMYVSGTYQESATCSPDEDEDFSAYELSLKVSIDKDMIIEIEDVEGTGEEYSSDNDAYIKKAVRKIVPQIIENGSPEEIDTISGATCTSKAILEACKKVLESAKR